MKKINSYLHKATSSAVLGLVDRKRRVLIPVYWEILHRVSEKNHEKGWKVAKRLLKHAAAFGFPKFTVVTDSWFAEEEFFDALVEKKLGYDFVIEIKSNRKVVGHGKKRNLNTDFVRVRILHHLISLQGAQRKIFQLGVPGIYYLMSDISPSFYYK